MTTRMASLVALALSAMATAMPPAAAAENPLVRAYNQSGLDLLKIFAGKPGNIVLSPYSIGSALAMTMSGARGDTRAEMRKVLRHSLAADEIDPANAKVLASLLAQVPAGTAKLRIANALMLVNAQATVAPEYEEAIRKYYNAELFRGANLDAVNRWVNDKTEGKIEKILDRLDPQTSHVILNAIYFNAPWTHAFAKNSTRDREFNLSADQKVEVPTMFQLSEFATVKGEGYAAIRLPYSAGGLSMAVVRPDQIGGLDALIGSLDAQKVQVLVKSLGEAQKKMVALSMPRFKTEYRADLIEPYKSLGMTKVFDPAQSDLSGLTGKSRAEQQSSIDQIVHRAVIDVAEEGTEAAASTAVAVTTRAMRPDDSERFDIDRPFLFLITDDTTGAILFAGRISDPRS